MNISEQMNLLTWGTDTILTEKELEEKLLKAEKENRSLTIKLGVDPTAPDIHLGHTVVLRKLRQFQDLGHEAVLIIGGFTAKIGDPSGKSKTRPPLNEEAIKENADTYLEQVKKILRPDRLRIVDNSQWLDPLSLKDLIGLFSHGTMAKLLEHNTFKDRFSQAGSIRMHEFLYPFLQGYDSIYLKADVELGGSDQLFNIAFGRELQKNYGQIPQCALLMPILVGTDGEQKMSKSLNNYIGVNDSPKVMSQKILNMTDDNIATYLRLLTPLSPEEVALAEKELSVEERRTEDILKWKHRLIEELLKVFHPGSSKDDLDVISISKACIPAEGLNLCKLIVEVGFAKSNREANQFIQSGATKVNDEKVVDRSISFNSDQFPLKLMVGKKKVAQIDLS